MSSRRFVATAREPLAAILTRMGVDMVEARRALGEGRVFVDRDRAQDLSKIVPPRAEVVLHDARSDVALPEPFVLHDRDGLLAVDKPAGIATIPDVRGARGTLLDLAARATKRDVAELHPTSRLDREVSGVVIFATNKEARELLESARADSLYARRYLAIAQVAAGSLAEDKARWTWAIARARDPKLRRAVAPGTRDALESATRVRVVARSGTYALLAVAPETGRTHQIRVHASAAGAPLVGDRAYGGTSRLTAASGKTLSVGRVALHCARVSIDAPRCMITVASPVPRELRELAAFVGLESAFEEALSCEV